MSVVDDLRKLLQDVVSPDFRALEARVTALDKKLDTRIDSLDKKLDMRIDALDKKLDMRADALDKKLDMRADALDKKIDTSIGMLEDKLAITRELLVAEMRAMHASLETSIARLTAAIDLDRRVAKIENERAAESRPPAPQHEAPQHAT